MVPIRLRGQPGPEIEGDRLNADLGALARIGATPEGGTHRVAYSAADLEARAFVRSLMQEAGLDVQTDLAGNLIGARPGRRPLAPIMLGSHIDSVPQGGNYDGQVGSMGAVAVARALHAAHHRTKHPLEFVIFQNEEGGKTGSRALTGEVAPKELDIVTASGRTIGEGVRLLGGDPDRLREAEREPGSVAAFLELHVEQGAVLYRSGTQIGVVEGIVGIKRWNVIITGFANHAGTTPMNDRHDAMLAAGAFVQAVNRVVRSIPGRQVGTVGRLVAEPGAPNVIAGQVTLSLEIRDLVMEKIDTVFAAVREAAGPIADETGTTFAFDQFYESRAAPTAPWIRDLVAAAADESAYSAVRLPSGAGHDAQSMARLGPVGMVFVPSVDGISHSPREYTPPDDVTRGARVLLRTLLKVDAALD